MGVRLPLPAPTKTPRFVEGFLYSAHIDVFRSSTYTLSMTFPLANATQQTNLFLAVFIVALVFSVLPKSVKESTFSLSPRITSELKGFAILAVVFSHIGYFLAQDHAFLYPLSVLAGVGVNLFFFLSGYGLTYSAINKPTTMSEFYRKRIIRIFIPLWITLALFFTLDKYLLHLSYSWTTIVQSFIGFFPRADLYTDLNSPLWYLTPLLFFYTLFPIIFKRKWPVVSAFVFGSLTIGTLLNAHVTLLENVLPNYQMHVVAFPLGVFVCAFFQTRWEWIKRRAEKISVDMQTRPWLKRALFTLVIVSLASIAGYTAIYSHVNEGLLAEQRTSLITMGSFILLFVFSPWRIRLFEWFGLFSYEIYLLHWPLMYRYDVLFSTLPAAFALVLSLLLFLGLGYALQQFSKQLLAHLEH